MTTLTIEHFTAAAARLGDDTTLRLREDKQGLATSSWERFKVAFCDLFFRSRNAIAAAKIDAIKAFLTATRQEYGTMVEALPPPLVEPGHLSGRQVQQTLAKLDQLGGRHWLSNQQKIALATRLDPPAPASGVTLTTLLERGLERVLKNLSDENGFLRQKYLSHGNQLNRDEPALQTIADRIAEKMQKACLDPKGKLRELSDQSILEIGTAAVAESLEQQDGDYLRLMYQLNHPAVFGWIDRLGLQNPRATAALIDACRQSKTIAEEERAALQKASALFGKLFADFDTLDADHRVAAFRTLGEGLRACLEQCRTEADSGGMDDSLGFFGRAAIISIGRLSRTKVQGLCDACAAPTGMALKQRLEESMNNQRASDDEIMESIRAYNTYCAVENALQRLA